MYIYNVNFKVIHKLINLKNISSALILKSTTLRAPHFSVQPVLCVCFTGEVITTEITMEIYKYYNDSIFFYLVCKAIGTAATPGLLCQPWVIVKMIVEKQMECRLTGETEVLRENLPQRHFCPSQNPT
jgi:hypothetical protein